MLWYLVTYSVRIGTGVGERNCLSKVAGVEGFFGSKNIEIVLILVLENCIENKLSTSNKTNKYIKKKCEINN